MLADIFHGLHRNKWIPFPRILPFDCLTHRLFALVICVSVRNSANKHINNLFQLSRISLCFVFAFCFASKTFSLWSSILEVFMLFICPIFGWTPKTENDGSNLLLFHRCDTICENGCAKVPLLLGITYFLLDCFFDELIYEYDLENKMNW